MENSDDQEERQEEELQFPYGIHRLLSKQEEQQLIAAAQAGDLGARNELMECNVRLVVSLARRYKCRSLVLEDMVQEGILGLVTAIEKFDLNRDLKFSTYATYWVRQAITRAIEKTDRLIRMPNYGCNSERRLYEVARRLENELGRQPSIEELSLASGIPKHIVFTYLIMITDPLSLNYLNGDDRDVSFIEILPDTEAVMPHLNSLHQHDKRTLLQVVQEALTERERQVVVLRFGFEDNRPHSLQQIGDEMGMTREGVRHIQTRALRKIREVLEGIPGFQPGMVMSSSVLPWG